MLRQGLQGGTTRGLKAGQTKASGGLGKCKRFAIGSSNWAVINYQAVRQGGSRVVERQRSQGTMQKNLLRRMRSVN